MSNKASVTVSIGLAVSCLFASVALGDDAPPAPPAGNASDAGNPQPNADQPAPAVETTAPSQPQSKEDAEMAARQEAANSLVKREGVIALPGDQATVTLGDRFSYLDQADTAKLLTKVWGNPPGAADNVIGAIVPRGIGMLEEHSWAAIISYKDDGHVTDSDAASINYDDLLREMQKAIEEDNPERVKQGYERMTLVGWAQKPSYNAAEHKLYWAKHLRFGTDEEMLNYAIRALGRTGVLEVNVVADMKELPAINAEVPKLLATISFTQTHRYADFNASSDSVAAYGLAALVAGGAAKAGLFKWLLAGAAASWKLIAAGIAVVGATISRFFRAIFGRRSPPAGDA